MLIITSKDFSGWILGGIATDCFLTNSKKNTLIFLERRILVYLKLYFLIFRNKNLIFINHHVLFNLKFPKILLRFKRYNILYTHSSMFIEKDKLHLLELANWIVVLNKNERDYLIKLGIESKNIKISFIGVDKSKFNRNNLKYTNDKSVILVSQYHPRKNLEPL